MKWLNPVLTLVVAAASARAADPPLPVKRLTLHPAAAPSPALKYPLLPGLRDESAGNAVLGYYRALNPEWTSLWRTKELSERAEKWSTMPLAELRRQDASWLTHNAALRELDLAARREDCNWEMTERIRQEGFALLLPDVQGLRELAKVLAVRARVEAAEGRFGKAVGTLQTGLRLARHVNEMHLLISSLVGIAVANQMLDQLEDLMTAPGAPNFYWPLTDLPRPFVDLREGFEGERLFVQALLPELRGALADPHAPPLSLQQIEAVVNRIAGAAGEAGGARGEIKFLSIVAVAKLYPQARRFLKSQGWTPQQVDALPVTEVVLLHAVNEYDRHFDEMFKWHTLPYWEASVGFRQADEQLRSERREGGIGGAFLAHLLLPAGQRVYFAAARLDRRIAALRCIEALRLLATAHSGRLPAALDEVRDVPVPVDPITGKPFGYQREGDKVVLSAPPPDGEPPSENNSLRYELTLAP